MNKETLLKLLDNITEDSKPVEKATFNKHDRVLVIDGLNLFLRNFSVLNYINQDGVHIGGLGGFLRSLGALINSNKPTSVYIVFDGIGSSINRKNLLPEYKSGRNVTRITNHIGFEDIDDVEPEQTLHLEAKHVEGRESILLKPFKFKKVWTLTLYVEESGGGNVSSIGGIQVVGNPL